MQGRGAARGGARSNCSDLQLAIVDNQLTYVRVDLTSDHALDRTRCSLASLRRSSDPLLSLAYRCSSVSCSLCCASLAYIRLFFFCLHANATCRGCLMYRARRNKNCPCSARAAIGKNMLPKEKSTRFFRLFCFSLFPARAN